MPGRRERGEEIADALVPLRRVGIGAGRDDHPVAVMTGGAERLLTVDHPLVAVGHRARAQRREVGTRVGFGVALGPHDLAGRHARQEEGLLLVGTEALDRRPHLHADTGEAAGAAAVELLLDDACLARRHLGAAVLVRPRGLEPTLRALLLPELAIEGPAVGVLLEVPLEALELGRELVVEPGSDLEPQRLEAWRRREADVHPGNLFRAPAEHHWVPGPRLVIGRTGYHDGMELGPVLSVGDAQVRVGTCSWTDKTLIKDATWYPKKTMTAAERLGYYAAQFSLVEADSTYYRPPTEGSPRVGRAQPRRLPHERQGVLVDDRTPDQARDVVVRHP